MGENIDQNREYLYLKHFADFQTTLALKKLLQVSDFAAKKIDLLKLLVEEDDCHNRLDSDAYQKEILSISWELPLYQYLKSLRHFRHRHFLRLYLRELSGFSTTQITTEDWSNFADIVIRHVVRYCQYQLENQYGTPLVDIDEVAELYVIGMGKLGGRELNFSSDIDLIFAYSNDGYTNGAAAISIREYFSKLVQNFVKILQQVTEDGIVFRVDLRLRPYGDSGPLVNSISAMETYYQEQGRDWERYAMVKARLLGESENQSSHWFPRLILPFVYRRYVDFSVIESLRSMKGMIEREIALNPMLNDIKRGQGGIREVEFTVQSFQLTRGGRYPELQHQSTTESLQSLHAKGLLPQTDKLLDAYWFLRKVENALQARNDQQTHRLPESQELQNQITIAMGLEDWDELSTQMSQYRHIISESFSRVLGEADIYADEKRLLANQLSSLWQGHVESNLAISHLKSLGYQDAERCYQMLSGFRHGPRCRRLSQVARLRLDRFMVLFLNELTQAKQTAHVLLQVIQLLENISGRSAYLALLIENPSVLRELLHWFETSPFITSLFLSQPFLLEVLVDQSLGWKPSSYKQLAKELEENLEHCADEESFNEALRQFKLRSFLKAARCESYGECRALQVGKFLADIAEVILQQVFRHACNKFVRHHPEAKNVVSRFMIVAYGKFGAREMNYDSDLDLVFLHSASATEEPLVTRLSQKIIHQLTQRSQAGSLYSVDTRLRPSGSSGLLVSQMSAFIDYQKNQAWTWEHQALTRARPLGFSLKLKKQFNRLKQEIFSLPRKHRVLAKDICEMRTRIHLHHQNQILKHDRGGLIDLEFLVQYLILMWSEVGCYRYTNTLSQLNVLWKNNRLSDEHFYQLSEAYKTYHHALHQTLLEGDVTAQLSHHYKNVAHLYKLFIES